MAAAKTTYRVKTNMTHNGEKLVDGDDVDLTEAQAEQALASGAVVPIEAPKAKAEKTEKVEKK